MRNVINISPVFRPLLALQLVLLALLLGNIPANAMRPEVAPRHKWPDGKQYMYRVELRDKRPSAALLSQPQLFLSAKSLERRRRQGISVDSLDLPVGQAYVEEIERRAHVSVVSRSRWNNSVVALTRDTTALDRLRQLPFVTAARLVWISPDSIPEHGPRPKWHSELELRDTTIHSPYGGAAHQLEMLGGTTLHARGFRGQGMTIAVLDAGFMNADLIPALRDIRLVGFADFVVPHSRSIFTEMEHGTQVLSTMAVNKPGIYVGAAPEAEYWLLRCEDQLSEQPVEEDYWAAAAEYADSVGCDILSSSLGFTQYDAPFGRYAYWQQDGRSSLISRTASLVASRGMVLVNSAGNEGMSAWKKITFPADADDMLSVGAVTPERRNAGFSSLGPTADGRVKPDVMAQGSPTMVVTERGTLTAAQGTSFACPLVAGLTACLWQEHLQLTARQIVQLVRSLSDNAQHPDNVFGYGIPDFGR